MNARRLFSGLCLSVLCLAAASPLFALANRVFVSARSGNDANSCSNIATPCQTFAGAVLQLNTGGEAIVLDSGGYGPVTITQSLTIEAPPGVVAFVHPPSGDAITVSAGASDIVVLRGLTLNGGSGSGIQVNSVGTLFVENSVIDGFGSFGIRVQASNSQTSIKDTITRQNGLSGILIFAAGRASLDHCRVEHNLSGIGVDGADVTVRDSLVANNLTWGLEVESAATESSSLNVYQSVVANNGGNGFDSIKGGDGPVTARIANSSVDDNASHGLVAASGVAFETLGKNLVRGNLAGDVSGVITIVPGQ